jgi:hypothetical protein
MVADRKRSVIVSERAASMSLLLRYTPDKVWKRLRLKAKQTRHHSKASASSPRKENWPKPSCVGYLAHPFVQWMVLLLIPSFFLQL